MDYRTDAPPILRDFLVYHETIQGHSRRTVDEYFLDLRNFLRFLKLDKGRVARNTPLDQISIDDSAILLEVKKASSSVLLCRVLRGGTLLSRKSLAVLGVDTPAPTLTREDLANLDLAGEIGVTCVMQPFVRGQEDIRALRQAWDQRWLGRIQIMAKIENRQGLDHLE